MFSKQSYASSLWAKKASVVDRLGFVICILKIHSDALNIFEHFLEFLSSSFMLHGPYEYT